HRVRELAGVRDGHGLSDVRAVVLDGAPRMVAARVLAPSPGLSLRSEIEAREARVLASPRRAPRLAERQDAARLPADDLDPTRDPLLDSLHRDLRRRDALRRVRGDCGWLSQLRHDPLLRAPLRAEKPDREVLARVSPRASLQEPEHRLRR